MQAARTAALPGLRIARAVRQLTQRRHAGGLMKIRDQNKAYLFNEVITATRHTHTREGQNAAHMY